MFTRASARLNPSLPLRVNEVGLASGDMIGPPEASAVPPSPFWRRSPFGVGGKLQFAFSIVAGLTAISTIVSLLCFAPVENGLRDFAVRQTPIIANVIQLSAISGEISAAAARLINAKTAGDQRKIADLIVRKRSDLSETLQRLQRLYSASPAVAKLLTLSQRLNANLAALEEIMTERNDLHGQIVGLSETLRQTQTRLLEQLARLPGSSAGTELSTKANVLVNLIDEAATLRDPTEFKRVQDALKAIADALRQSAAALQDKSIADDVNKLLLLTIGTNSIFARHARELFVATRADATIDENVAIQSDLDKAVADLVNAAQDSVKSGTAALTETVDGSRVLLLVVAFASILAAAGVGVFYVQRRLVRQLISISDAMRRLASGDVDSALPSVFTADELGEMSRSLHVLHAGELERRKLIERERSEQSAQRHRASSIDRIIEDFRAAVTSIVTDLTSQASAMETTARGLSTIASEADNQARTVSHSSEETSTNVQSVASATEELGISIHAINEQAGQTRGVVARAAEIARSAHKLGDQLSSGAGRIGDVVKLIRNVAEQTNLLALNATIEAARAGQGGKGFAVVANEIKQLASQTAKATEDITTQIAAIQTSTIEAVDAIESINAVTDDIARFTAAVAASVEQQNDAAQMITRNVQGAAGGVHDLAGNMTRVTKVIGETNRFASEVLEVAHTLSSQTSNINKAVEHFLKRVAAV